MLRLAAFAARLEDEIFALFYSLLLRDCGKLRDRFPCKNLFVILLRERDQGSCAAQNAHVLKYIPLFALRFRYSCPADPRSLQILNRF